MKKEDQVNNEFDSIHNEEVKFIMKNNRTPSVLIMHPEDGKKFINWVHQTYGYCALGNIMNYRGMKLIRSFDVEEGRWVLL